MENVPAMSLDKKAVRILISLWVYCAKHMTRPAVPKKSPPDFKSARNQTADAIPSWRFVSSYGFCEFSSLKNM